MPKGPDKSQFWRCNLELCDFSVRNWPGESQFWLGCVIFLRINGQAKVSFGCAISGCVIFLCVDGQAKVSFRIYGCIFFVRDWTPKVTGTAVSLTVMARQAISNGMPDTQRGSEW